MSLVRIHVFEEVEGFYMSDINLAWGYGY